METYLLDLFLSFVVGMAVGAACIGVSISIMWYNRTYK